jgi:hypothetical protein
MDYAAYDAELDQWIGYLETAMPDCPDHETCDDVLIEQIDKAHRRGVISDQLAFDLADHFDVLDAFR